MCYWSVSSPWATPHHQHLTSEWCVCYALPCTILQTDGFGCLICVAGSGSPYDREVHLLQPEQGRVHGRAGEACQRQPCRHCHWYRACILDTSDALISNPCPFNHFSRTGLSCIMHMLNRYLSSSPYAYVAILFCHFM